MPVRSINLLFTYLHWIRLIVVTSAVLFLVVGGYDRGECLNSVESFDLTTNTWTPLKPLLVARGRFAVAELDGCLYACGGSNGQMDLCSAECYDPNTASWTSLPDMTIQRSYAGSFFLFLPSPFYKQKQLPLPATACTVVALAALVHVLAVAVVAAVSIILVCLLTCFVSQLSVVNK